MALATSAKCAARYAPAVRSVRLAIAVRSCTEFGPMNSSSVSQWLIASGERLHPKERRREAMQGISAKASSARNASRHLPAISLCFDIPSRLRIRSAQLRITSFDIAMSTTQSPLTRSLAALVSRSPSFPVTIEVAHTTR